MQPGVGAKMEIRERWGRGDGNGNGSPGYVVLGGLLALSELVSSAEEMGVKMSAMRESGHSEPSAILPQYPRSCSLGALGLLTLFLPPLLGMLLFSMVLFRKLSFPRVLFPPGAPLRRHPCPSLSSEAPKPSSVFLLLNSFSGEGCGAGDHWWAESRPRVAFLPPYYQ